MTRLRLFFVARQNSGSSLQRERGKIGIAVEDGHAFRSLQPVRDAAGYR